MTACQENQSYDYLTNKCSPLQPDYYSFPNKTDTMSSSQNNILSNGTLTIPKINCVNGFNPPNSSLCVCYTGWTDENSGNTSNTVQKCNRVLDGFSNKSSSTTNNLFGNTTTAQMANTSYIYSVNSPEMVNSSSGGLPGVKFLKIKLNFLF